MPLWKITDKGPSKVKAFDRFLNQPFKFLTLWLICSIVVLGFSASDISCGSSIENLRKSAEQGDAEAQYELGWMHARYQLFKDEGISQNQTDSLSEAFKWYRKAAEQGSVFAELLLGHLYHNEGEHQNFKEAVKWYRNAAEKRDENAQYFLAMCYLKGEGVPKNEIEALAWIYLSEANGQYEAKNARGIIENQLGRQATRKTLSRSLSCATCGLPVSMPHRCTRCTSTNRCAATA